jgi:hypothetical protein
MPADIAADQQVWPAETRPIRPTSNLAVLGVSRDASRRRRRFGRASTASIALGSALSRRGRRHHPWKRRPGSSPTRAPFSTTPETGDIPRAARPASRSDSPSHLRAPAGGVNPPRDKVGVSARATTAALDASVASVNRAPSDARAVSRWRPDWRTSVTTPANLHLRNGLENRYPSLGGSRVRIPPPPLFRPAMRPSAVEQPAL